MHTHKHTYKKHHSHGNSIVFFFFCFRYISFSVIQFFFIFALAVVLVCVSPREFYACVVHVWRCVIKYDCARWQGCGYLFCECMAIWQCENLTFKWWIDDTDACAWNSFIKLNVYSKGFFDSMKPMAEEVIKAIRVVK